MGWKEKFISKASREILIKTIAQAIPTYTMSLFKLPKAPCDYQLHTSQILVGANKGWEENTLDKLEKIMQNKKKGGMGFRDIQAFNLAMLAKHTWRLIHHTHSLFYCIYKARYFPNSSFMEAEIEHNPSYVWWSLVAAREVIMEGSRWRVGNGRQIEVGSRNWRLEGRRPDWW